jgi:hypothetical protein
MRFSLFIMAFALLLGGCASEQGTSQSTTLSPEQYRKMYPRQYLDNLNPSERKRAEYLMEREKKAPGSTCWEAWP